jgi:methylmalonyl-CoA mutase
LARTGVRPKIFLATLGTPADFSARVNFARNFFEAGGIEAVGGDEAPASLGSAFKASGAALACLCAPDKMYDSEGAQAAKELKAAGARHIYLAGRPRSNEAALLDAGIGTFIYAGCDMLAVLQAAHGPIADGVIAS